MTARYAIYWAPPFDSVLWRTAARWLGRDAATGESFAPPPLDQIEGHDLASLTASARHYGFHATLKPPFPLRAGVAPTQLRDAAARFSAARLAFDAPPLKLDRIGGFLALTLTEACPAMQALADDCVRFFDPLREPASEAELAKRRAAGLTERQDSLLARWGYPYVFDEFRFHLTLTDRLTPDQMVAIWPRLSLLTAEHARQGFRIESIAVFRQASREAPFVVDDLFGFGSV